MLCHVVRLAADFVCRNTDGSTAEKLPTVFGGPQNLADRRWYELIYIGDAAVVVHVQGQAANYKKSKQTAKAAMVNLQLTGFACTWDLQTGDGGGNAAEVK